MRVIVDWDGTLVHNVWPDEGDWLPGAVSALRNMVSRGWQVRVHSARLSPYAPPHGTELRRPEDVRREYAYVKRMLKKEGLYPKVGIFRSRGKPGADVYIDDRALRFEGDWTATMKDLLSLNETKGKDGTVYREILPMDQQLSRAMERIHYLESEVRRLTANKRERVDI